jgi:hypothetical protein
VDALIQTKTPRSENNNLGTKANVTHTHKIKIKIVAYLL